MKTEVRIDKWLWAVRIFKTRNLAAEACKKGRILLNGIALKPSKNIKIGDTLQVRTNPVIYSFKVLNLTENRIGAKLVPEYMLNTTTADQLELLELHKLNKTINRARGTGRPTKKERREIDSFFEDDYFFEEND
ncbi:MAG: RNA-binding S4 domain-containing protein [Paludibacteraceae bacterium]|nr:RNA-binding S4 domain-containing protein [Paludibacteraceae bacterium]MBN2786690.1 RNA-binding S4 domain-containing protein [Paludibacteraceae bacterium]